METLTKIETDKAIIIIAHDPLYDREYGYNESDYKKSLILYNAIVNRDKNKLQVGDIIECHGTRIYKNGHLEMAPIKDTFCNICTQAYVPFVSLKSNGVIYTNTSGGYWLTEPDPTKFNRIDERKKNFCFFGHNGACAGGAVTISVPVTVWKYINMAEIY